VCSSDLNHLDRKSGKILLDFAVEILPLLLVMLERRLIVRFGGRPWQVEHMPELKTARTLKEVLQGVLTEDEIRADQLSLRGVVSGWSAR
jgi:hypothetical protein